MICQIRLLGNFVEGQEHGPIDSRYFSDYFVLSVQVLVPSQGQELDCRKGQATFMQVSHFKFNLFTIAAALLPKF